MTVLRQTGIKIVDTREWPSIERGRIFRDWIEDDDGIHVRVPVDSAGARWLSCQRFKPVYRVPARTERVSPPSERVLPVIEETADGRRRVCDFEAWSKLP